MQINVNVTFQENPYDVIQRYTRTLSWGCQVNIRKISAAVKVDTGISYLLRRITDLLCFMVALTLFLLLIIAKQQEQVIFKSVQRLRSWSLAEQPPVCKGCNCGYGPSCPINTAVHPVLNTESLADGHHLSPSSPEFAIWKQKKPRVIFQTIYGSCSPDSNLLTVLKKTKSFTWFFFSTVPVSWFFFPGWCMFLLAHCFRFLFLFPASDIIISLSKQLSNNWHPTYRPSRYVITPLGFHFDFSYKLVKFHDFILHALCDLSRSESKKTARSAGSSSQTWNNPGLETFLAEGLCWVWANKQT